MNRRVLRVPLLYLDYFYYSLYFCHSLYLLYITSISYFTSVTHFTDFLCRRSGAQMRVAGMRVCFTFLALLYLTCCTYFTSVIHFTCCILLALFALLLWVTLLTFFAGDLELRWMLHEWECVLLFLLYFILLVLLTLLLLFTLQEILSSDECCMNESVLAKLLKLGYVR